MSRTKRLAAAAAALAMLPLAACSGGSATADDAKSITVWTTDTEQARVADTERIISDFTKETGIKVKLVSIAEDQLIQTVTSAAAAGELPDAMGGLSLASVRTLSSNDLLDTETTTEIVESLGAGTFSQESLALTREGDTQLAVPSHIWSQMLIYRKDLFAKEGLAPPETYEDVLKAAKTLDGGGMAGFVGPTAPSDVFTQQTFEQIALANGCQLVDESGQVALDSSQCVGAFDFYDQLSNYSIPGAQDVDTTLAAYFSGKAAMIPWSTYILDEMAGLVNDTPTTCPECRADPAYLAKNSGFVTTLEGPDGEPAQFGEVVSWGIPTDAASDSARKFVEYMMTDGYVDWTAMAPEGKFPARQGTETDQTKFVDAWETLPMGVDRKAPLSKFYSDEVLDQIRTGPEEFERWGIKQGQGDLVGAMLGELPVPKAVAAMTSGETGPRGAAAEATELVRSIQESGS